MPTPNAEGDLPLPPSAFALAVMAAGVPQQHWAFLTKEAHDDEPPRLVKEAELKRWNRTEELLDAFATQLTTQARARARTAAEAHRLKQEHHEASAHSLEQLTATVTALQSERAQLDSTLNDLEAAAARLLQNEEETSKRTEKARELTRAAEETNAVKVAHVTAAAQLLQQTSETLQLVRSLGVYLKLARHELELERRSAFNTLQELKGNLRVICRFRPAVLPSEQGSTLANFTFSEDGTAVTVPTRRSGNPASFKDGDHSNAFVNFQFDKVFSYSHGQAAIFDEVSHFVQSALDGFDVCLFAYGQTGSGKTHTMMGKLNPAAPEAGVIPRALELIFTSIKSLARTGIAYRAWLSVMEIHNETLRDLLVAGEKVLEVRLDAKGNPSVPNKTQMEVTSTPDVLLHLATAEKHRSVAATAANARSSRSHCVVQLKIAGRSVQKNFESMLSLVDLAGSERLERSQACGERLREAQAINKSLSCLGDVISALATRRAHVPFRNSKLTVLLRNSLGGSAKTLMFVNCSPLQEHLNETLCSLKFAARAAGCPDS